MLKVKIYAATFILEYGRALKHLESEGLMDIEYLGTHPISYLIGKLNNNLWPFRKLRGILTGKDNIFENERTVKEIIQSFLAPFTLLFTRDVLIVSIPPYSKRILYLLLLKKLKKDMIYSTSWPYWDYEKYIIRADFITKQAWESFLSGMVSVAMTRSAMEGLKTMGARAHHIPHSVDTTLFKPKEKQGGKARVLYVGRMTEEKGIRGILKAAEKFRERDIEFYFVGAGPLAPLIKQSEKNLSVRHLEHVKDTGRLAEIYADADIFVLNSYTTGVWEEIFGIVLIEAMSCGLPVIATDCVGPKEVVVDGVNGYLIRQKDDADLQEKLKLLIGDRHLREKMGEEGRRIAIERYDVAKVAKEWLKVLKV